MNKSFLLALAAALIAAPAALAHDPAGTLKNYCEDPSEWGVHDYAPPADGTLIALGSDGNLAGDCNGDGVPADFDGHVEWAVGGGWLDVDSGDGVTGGTIACYGTVGHHPFFGPISVTDTVLGNTAPFAVTADTINLIPPTDPTAPNCGDFEADESTDCVGSCTVTFPPGLDGSYPIFVGDAATGALGSLGHIETAVAPPPIPCGPSTVIFQNGLAASVLIVSPGIGRSITAATHANPSTANDIETVHVGNGNSNPSTHTWVITGAGAHTYNITTVCNAPFAGGNEVFAGAFTHII